MTNPDQLPPNDIEAECGALGCILRADGEAGGKMLASLSSEDFYDARHRKVFQTLKGLHGEH
ncbi:MAG: DnaB-like helicase N-terminal domain-containing protein, partial [Limisphaerales bacterium]